jgi:hypothetical protein
MTDFKNAFFPPFFLEREKLATGTTAIKKDKLVAEETEGATSQKLWPAI